MPGKLRSERFTTAAVALAVVFFVLSVSLLSAQNARDRFEAAESAADAQDYTAAVQYYRDAIDLNPGYREAWQGLAVAYRELDELDEALDAVRQARRLGERDTSIIALEGDILLLRGLLDEARTAFERVLEIEPNNVDARIGLAELDLADDRRTRAIEAYLDVLDLEPQSRRALLALAVLYDDRGDSEAAERYLSLSLEFHPRDPMVNELVGDYFLAAGEIDRARQHAGTAVALDERFARGWALLTRIELQAGDYEAALEAARFLVDINSEDNRAWYLLGLARRGMNDYEAAIDAFDRATTINPDDELARLALESAAADGFELEDDVRRDIASYRFGRAASLADENLFIQATADYRRGLSLYPFSRDGRYELAVLHRRRGLTGKFLEELRVLQSLGFDDVEITDGISTYESVLAEGVAAGWEIDQFDTPRDRMTFGLFHYDSATRGSRPKGAHYATEYLRHRLLGYEVIEVKGEVRSVSTAADAFRAARADALDYYIILDFSESDRSIAMAVELRHADTGNLIAELTARRSGTRRVQRAAAAVVSAIEAELPARGRLLERRGGTVLVNLGATDGIEIGEELLVVRRDQFATASDRVGYRYDENDLVGRIEVTGVDDLVSEGRLRREGFFDLVETGDTVLQQLEGRVESIDDRPAYAPLYWRIRELRTAR